MEAPTTSTLNSTKGPTGEDQQPVKDSSTDAQAAGAFQSAGPYFPEPPSKTNEWTMAAQSPVAIEDIGVGRSLMLPEINIISSTSSSPSPPNNTINHTSATDALSLQEDGLTHVEPCVHCLGPDIDLPPTDPEDMDGRALMIGISGSPAAGKSTLLNMLKLILPSANPILCIYQDDFDRPMIDVEPNGRQKSHENGMEDVDWESMRWILDYARRRKRLPGHYTSKHNEQEERIAATDKIRIDTIDNLNARLESSGHFAGTTTIIVDGSLLYHDPGIRKLLDINLFLRVDKSTALKRRVGQVGNAGVKRQDAERERLDNIDWPNYAQVYASFFKNLDVEEDLELEVMENLGIIPQPALSARMQATKGFEPNLQWATTEIVQAVRRIEIDKRTKKRLDSETRYEPCDCRGSLLGKIRKMIYNFL